MKFFKKIFAILEGTFFFILAVLIDLAAWTGFSILYSGIGWTYNLVYRTIFLHERIGGPGKYSEVDIPLMILTVTMFVLVSVLLGLFIYFHREYLLSGNSLSKAILWDGILVPAYEWSRRKWLFTSIPTRYAIKVFNRNFARILDRYNSLLSNPYHSNNANPSFKLDPIIESNYKRAIRIQTFEAIHSLTEFFMHNPVVKEVGYGKLDRLHINYFLRSKSSIKTLNSYPLVKKFLYPNNDEFLSDEDISVLFKATIIDSDFSNMRSLMSSFNRSEYVPYRKVATNKHFPERGDSFISQDGFMQVDGSQTNLYNTSRRIHVIAQRDFEVGEEIYFEVERVPSILEVQYTVKMNVQAKEDALNKKTGGFDSFLDFCNYTSNHPLQSIFYTDGFTDINRYVLLNRKQNLGRVVIVNKIKAGTEIDASTRHHYFQNITL